jgi:uncharacterized protein
MKIFFDTNVYVAEALLGQMAEQLVEATQKAGWRIFCTSYVLEELERVLTEKLGFSRKLSLLSRRRILHRARPVVEVGASRHEVIQDIKDSPILQSALVARADYLVTNDKQLLVLDPYEGLRIISMTAYYELLKNEGYFSIDS